MTDNVAVLEGYTEAITADCSQHKLFLLVKPDTDFDDAFRAWDCDAQEFIRVNGWLFSIEPGHDDGTDMTTSDT